jgi:hypothetical protein
MATRIGEAGNTTHGFPLGILAERGFTVVRGPDDGEELWAIHADGTSLIGSSPLVLLGLLAIVDHLGPDWYRAPRVNLPKAHILDLAPQDVAKIPETQVPAAGEAIRLLASIRGRTVARGDTREELIAASRAWVEETQRVVEFNQSDEKLD